MKKILVLNTGSSSIKFKLFNLINNNFSVEKHGEIDAIGTNQGPRNHRTAVSLLFDGFGIRQGSLYKIDGLTAIVHRVVHGGDKYTKPTLINSKVIKDLEQYNILAPLHNPNILEVIKITCENNGKKDHRNIDNYAVFDTGFYSNLPDKSKFYAIPEEYQIKYNIHRYGFHGLSHKFAYEQVAKKHGTIGRMISIHLGAGCSITAIKNGQAVDTSMGMTPLEGLIMGSRCGDIDPGIIQFLANQAKLTLNRVNEILTEESGLLGVSGFSSEMEDILFVAGYKVKDDKYKPSQKLIDLSEEYQVKARQAIDMFVYRIQKYIGAYYSILGGLDVLSFTGKIGVGSSVIRSLILKDIKHLFGGIFSNTKVVVVPTDEEYEIAKEVLSFINIKT